MVDDLGEEGANGSTLIYEQKPDRKQVQDLWNQIDDLGGCVNELRGLTAEQITSYKTKFWNMCTDWLKNWKEDLKNDSLKKKNND